MSTDLDTLRARAVEARAAADAATPGGLHGDPGTLSGIRRRGGQRADARRFAAYDREATAARDLAAAEEAEARRAAKAERDAADAAAPCDLDKIGRGDYVRTRHGWHRVVRVSPKSVTVETPYSWTDRIARNRIVETRRSAAS